MSAIFTLMVDSMATSLYTKKHTEVMPESREDGHHELPVVSGGHFHGHHHGDIKELNVGSQLLRYRVIAMVSIFIPFFVYISSIKSFVYNIVFGNC